MQLTHSDNLTDRSDTVLIIGAGTWGLSTALHLARRNYKTITVLDGQSAVPSPISAGNDVNKILELSSSAPSGSTSRIVSDKLARDAIEGWRGDAVFAGLFHETGVVVAACSEAGKKALEEVEFDDGWCPIEGADEFRKTMPDGVLTGDFPGWKGYYKSGGCGWVEARHALIKCAREAERLGVQFVRGERGRVTSLIYEDDDVKGAVVAYGEAFRADKVILCAGANAAELLDMKGQLRPTAWTLAHVKMTPDEAELYHNLPVLFNIERGFFMEPDAKNHELKICDEHPGYCNWETLPSLPVSSSAGRQQSETKGDANKSRSVPFAYHQIPKEAENRVRMFLSETMPHLAQRPLSFARICWCADTPDRQFLISRHPDYPSLVLGVGGSGHGFSYVPAIGGVIADCLEGTMHPLMKQLFRWRPETAECRDWTAVQNRFGPPGSNHVMDFQSVKEWTRIQVGDSR